MMQPPQRSSPKYPDSMHNAKMPVRSTSLTAAFCSCAQQRVRDYGAAKHKVPRAHMVDYDG
jgi:hypothetical protein